MRVLRVTSLFNIYTLDETRQAYPWDVSIHMNDFLCVSVPLWLYLRRIAMRFYII